MTKVTLADVGNLIDATTAATTINNNSAAIVAAMEKTLSRDGTSPNQMTSQLDMNSNRIINLPAPGGPNDPVRLQDVTGSPTIDLSITLTGDVTSPTGNGNLPTTISPAAVTGTKIANATIQNNNIADATIANAKLATMANNRLKGNVSGSTASPSDITMSQALDSISATQGTILYRGSSAWTALSPGSAGQYLQTNGAGNNPSWTTIAGASSITPEQFGAVGNGITDDSAAIDAFVVACQNNQGVMTPGKTYLVSQSFRIRPNTHIYAYGATIKAANTAGTMASHLLLTDITGGAGNGPSNVIIEGLTINGNATVRRANGSITGVGQYASIYVASCNNVTIRDCYCDDSEGDNYYMGGGTNPGTNNTTNSVFYRCIGNNPGRNCFSVVGTQECLFDSCIGQNASYGAAHSNISCGWDYEPDNAGSQNTGTHCINCYAINCKTGFAEGNSPNLNCNIMNCYAQSNTIGFNISNAGGIRLIGTRAYLNSSQGYAARGDSIPSFP